MRRYYCGQFLTWAGAAVWFLVIVLPLGSLFLSMRVADIPGPETLAVGRYGGLVGRSLLWAAAVAAVSVLAGWPAGRLMGANARARKWGVLLLLIPLLIPPQVIFYAYGLLLLPTSRMGMYLSGSEGMISLVNGVRAVLAMGLWYWPMCGLILGLGWRRTEPEIWAQARLDAGVWSRWVRVGVPMLGRAIGAAWLLVFMLTLSQFAVFHLAGVETMGTELAVVYQMTGNPRSVAWASLPMVLCAAGVAGVTVRFFRPEPARFDLPDAERVWSGHWLIAGGLWTLSALAPVALLAGHAGGWRAVARFGLLSGEGLLSSGLIAGGAAAVATATAGAVLLQARYGRGALAGVMNWSVMLAALLPGSLVGAAMVHTFNRGIWAEAIYNQPWMVSAGHGVQLAVLAVILAVWVRASLPAEIGDLAKLDGADGLRGAVHVWLPGLWPAAAAGGLLAGTLSMMELPAMLVLLPAGVPNFAQQLLNQMHYARDEEVIASLLLWIAVSGAVAGGVFACVRLTGRKETPQRTPRARRRRF